MRRRGDRRSGFAPRMRRFDAIRPKDTHVLRAEEAEEARFGGDRVDLCPMDESQCASIVRSGLWQRFISPGNKCPRGEDVCASSRQGTIADLEGDAATFAEAVNYRVRDRVDSIAITWHIIGDTPRQYTWRPSARVLKLRREWTYESTLADPESTVLAFSNGSLSYNSSADR